MIIPKQLAWRIHVDGLAEHVGIVYTPKSGRIKQCIKFRFLTTNNEVEYEAIMISLKIIEILNLAIFEIISDSKIVIGQITGDMKSPHVKYEKILEDCLGILKNSAFIVKFTHKTKESNIKVGTLDGLTPSLSEYETQTVQIEVPDRPSMEANFCFKFELDQVPVIRGGPMFWFHDLIQFLDKGILLFGRPSQDYRYQIQEVHRPKQNALLAGSDLHPLLSLTKCTKVLAPYNYQDPLFSK